MIRFEKKTMSALIYQGMELDFAGKFQDKRLAKRGLL
jgi:hypothetical protein